MNIDLTRIVNWKTTGLGIAYLVCNVVGKLWPEAEAACGIIDKIIIAFGLMSAADAARVQNVVQAVDGLLGIKPAVPAVVVIPEEPVKS